jgi:hypothetical protein
MHSRGARWSLLLSLIALGAVAWLVWGQLATDGARRSAEQQASDAEQTKRYTAQQFLEACRTVDGDEPAELAQACRIAAEVVNAPDPVPPEDGRDGVGVASVQPGDCAVTIRLTDGRTRTIGDLCGAEGEPGEPGRGIASVEQDDCYVVVAYTDGSGPSRLGPFCGEDGTDGEDGKTPPCLSEPGQCRGAAGEAGEDGQPPAGWTTEYPDGGREECRRAEGFDPQSPRYTCTYTPPNSDTSEPNEPLPGG